MKTVDDAFISEQNRLTGSKAIEEIRVYKKYPWPISDITSSSTLKVIGHAEDHFSVDDWFTVTTRKFSTKFRVTSASSYSSGETIITSDSHGLGVEQDVGGYLAKRYDVSRQVLKIGTISQGFEGQTLNEFRTGATTIELNDRAYINLYDEINQAGVFYQKSWTDLVTNVSPGAGTTTFTINNGGLTNNILRGYIAQLLSGSYEGKAYPIIANTANTVTVLGVLVESVVGDELLLAIENYFYLEILAGFKGAL